MAGPASPISRGAARRLDRLSRGAHLFHRHAHHPLCDEYASEVIRVGRRVRLCRGCTLVALGGLGGVAAAPVLPIPSWVGAAIACVAAGAVVWFSFGPLGRLPGVRLHGKWVTRVAPAAALAFAAVSGLRSLSVAGAVVAFAALAIIALLRAAYRARTPDRTPCERCPERTAPVACRGLAPIVRRERAFQRRARTILAAAGA